MNLKSTFKLGIASLCIGAIAGLPLLLQAQTTTPEKPPVEHKDKSKKPPPAVTPFHGKLKSVDKTAKTISVGTLVLQITSETKIAKADKPAVLEDGVVGENVS